MRGICAIVLDKDKIFLAFACIKGRSYFFLKEDEMALSSESGDTAKFLNRNITFIDKRIKEIEKSFSFKVETIHLQSPWEQTSAKAVTDTIPFQKKQKVTSKVIKQSKKYIQDKFLDWDEHCLHHIILEYDLEGTKYKKIPLGMNTRKLGLGSVLFSVKTKFYREVEAALDNVDRDFSGFIAPQIGIFSSAPLKPEGNQVSISLAYDKTYYVARVKNNFSFENVFDFGLKNIIQALADKFMISFSLADEVFCRYVSFKEIPYNKEITIKKDDTYLKVSTHSLNLFIKDLIKSKLGDIIQSIKKIISEDEFAVAFLGRLNDKDGFYTFLRDCLKLEVMVPIQACAISSALGCLDYGFYRHFEKIYDNDAPFFQKIINTYHEYF